MLLPSFSTAAATASSGIFFLGQECDMPHGFFGDRDAHAPSEPSRTPPYCGLFGRRGDAPPPPPSGDPDRANVNRMPGGRA